MNARTIRIAPSLLSADFARLGAEVASVCQAGADLIHFDVMDNHYVPNLTMGPMVCEAIREYARVGKDAVAIDVHLMVSPVDSLIPLFAKAGAAIVTFHPEASAHVDRTLQLIRDHGMKAGLALNPATPLNCLDHVVERLDMVLLMSVNPGFGGQSFIESSLPKIRAVRTLIASTGRDIRLEVDGGVNGSNVERIVAAGADTLVAGSAVFGTPDHAAAIAALRVGAARARATQVDAREGEVA